MPNSLVVRTLRWEIWYCSLNLLLSSLTPGQNRMLLSSPHSVSYIQSFICFAPCTHIWKKAFHFVSNRMKQCNFFISVGKTEEKQYFWFYPKLLCAYGHIHFPWFCFIAKTIKPITHTALDGSGGHQFCQATLEVASVSKLMKYCPQIYVAIAQRRD